MSVIGFSSGWATLFWESDGEDPIDTVIYRLICTPEILQKPKLLTTESHVSLKTYIIDITRFAFSPEFDRDILGRKATLID